MRLKLVILLVIAVTTGAFGQTVFSVSMDGTQAGTGSTFTGSGTVTLNAAEDEIEVTLTHDIPSGDVRGGHIHMIGGLIVFPFTDGISPINETYSISFNQVTVLKAGEYYMNIHTNAHLPGEIRGEILKITWVDFAFGGSADGSELNPYNTLAEGLMTVPVRGVIHIKGYTDTSTTDETPTIDQAVTVQAVGGTVSIGTLTRKAENTSRAGFVSRDAKRE